MINLKIDNIDISVEDGISVLQAAASVGIEIPAMCFLEGHSCHPSCMVCMVKDENKGSFFASCAMPVMEGMRVTATSPEVHDLRRESLELLMSDHVGDCEAPCTLTCPAGMNIPLMNRLIAKGEFEKALDVVREKIALPIILGYVCAAPCEKACRRKSIDGAVSICLLKRFTAQDYEIRISGLKNTAPKTGKKVAIVGTGPAGLSAAFYLLQAGIDCTLFDKNPEAGGTLRYSIPEEELPRSMLEADIDYIRRMGAVFTMNSLVTNDFIENSLAIEFDAVVIASGGDNDHVLNNEIPRVFACGNNIRKHKMAVKAAAIGRQTAVEVGIYLKLLNPEHKIKFNSAFGHLSKPEEQEYLKESPSVDRIAPQGGFVQGFGAGEAISEASRCMHCDCRKPLSCKLRIYADQYGVNRKKHLGPERKQLTKSVHHNLIIYEAEKCIRCGLCVEISTKEESLGLSYIGRGFDVRINVPFNETMADALKQTAELCVIACPTGAMALKDTEETNKTL